MPKQSSIPAKGRSPRAKLVAYLDEPRVPKPSVIDSESKTERITLNLTADKRDLLGRLRQELEVRSIGEVMRRAFVLYQNLLHRTRNGESILLHHPNSKTDERLEDKPVKIHTDWRDENEHERSDGSSRAVVGLRVEQALRTAVDDMTKGKDAPTITQLAEGALEKLALTLKYRSEGYQLLARREAIAGSDDRLEYFLNPDGTAMHRSGGDIVDLDAIQFRDRQEYTEDYEYVRQIVLKDIVATSFDPVYALTLDRDGYFSKFWSGPLWETFLKTHMGHKGKVYRIFVLDETEIREDTGKAGMIWKVLKKNEQMGVECKVLFKDNIVGWLPKHDTSFLLSGDYVSESYSLTRGNDQPGYVLRDADSTRARQLKAFWDTLDLNNPSQIEDLENLKKLEDDRLTMQIAK